MPSKYTIFTLTNSISLNMIKKQKKNKNSSGFQLVMAFELATGSLKDTISNSIFHKAWGKKIVDILCEIVSRVYFLYSEMQMNHREFWNPKIWYGLMESIDRPVTNLKMEWRLLRGSFCESEIIISQLSKNKCCWNSRIFHTRSKLIICCRL